MKTFTHKSIDYVMKNYKKMTVAEIEEHLKGMEFLFKGSNPTYGGGIFIIDSVRVTATPHRTIRIVYHYPNNSDGPGSMSTSIKEFFEQVVSGRRVPLN